MSFKRFAIYYTPPQGDFASFGAAWLGWDLVSGQSVAHPAIQDLDLAEITETPRKYGFHATMKPPFRLAVGATAETLITETVKICRGLAPVTLDGLKLHQIGRFLAFVPLGNERALNALAESVVRAFDTFRAPATEAELARRRKARLSPAQEANLTTWGYPYVMDEFHFHMTLTGRLNKELLAPVTQALTDLSTSVLPQPFCVDSLTLVGEQEDGQFAEIQRFALGATA